MKKGIEENKMRTGSKENKAEVMISADKKGDYSDRKKKTSGR